MLLRQDIRSRALTYNRANTITCLSISDALQLQKDTKTCFVSAFNSEHETITK